MPRAGRWDDQAHLEKWGARHRKSRMNSYGRRGSRVVAAAPRRSSETPNLGPFSAQDHLELPGAPVCCPDGLPAALP